MDQPRAGGPCHSGGAAFFSQCLRELDGLGDKMVEIASEYLVHKAGVPDIQVGLEDQVDPFQGVRGRRGSARMRHDAQCAQGGGKQELAAFHTDVSFVIPAGLGAVRHSRAGVEEK